jgi:hypothetical protein
VNFTPKDPASTLVIVSDFGMQMAYPAKAVIRESGMPSYSLIQGDLCHRIMSEQQMVFASQIVRTKHAAINVESSTHI